MANAIQYRGTGRRKTSVAQVRLIPGEGKVLINKRPLGEYFGKKTLEMVVKQPLDQSRGTLRYHRQRPGRRHHRPGWRCPSGCGQSPVKDRCGTASCAEKSRFPYPGSPDEGKKEIRPERRPQSSPVLKEIVFAAANPCRSFC